MNTMRFPHHGMPPVAKYIYDAEHTINVVEKLFGREVGKALAYEFTCGNKVRMSRRAARKVRKEHNESGRRTKVGIASIYRCWECKRYHVHSVLQKMDLIERLNKLLTRTGKAVPYSYGVIDVSAV